MEGTWGLEYPSSICFNYYLAAPSPTLGQFQKCRLEYPTGSRGWINYPISNTLGTELPN